MIHICLKDKTHIVNITTCFVQRGSYDDSREYLQEAGDRPTHFRDSEKSGRKILRDFFRFAEEKNTFLYNFAGGCHKNCFTLAVVGPTETLPTLSSCSQERSPDFSHIFSRESPGCLYEKREIPWLHTNPSVYSCNQNHHIRDNIKRSESFSSSK